MATIAATINLRDGVLHLEVDAEALREALGAAPTTEEHFTSAHLPPGTSRRAFAARCRRLPDARRCGRTWVIPVESWWAACRRGSAPQVTPQASPEAAALLGAAGLRLRGGRRAA